MENKLEHFPSCEDQTHLLEVWHVQQGGDFKFVKKLSEVFEGMLGSGKDGAEAGNDIQQGVEQAICFRGYQSLTGQQKEKKWNNQYYFHSHKHLLSSDNFMS